MRGFGSLFGASVLALAAPLAAQSSVTQEQALAREEDDAPDVSNAGGEVIVTGRVGAGEQRKIDASYAITTLDQDLLRLDRPASVADVFRNVPGFWVESSGGEASNNIRVRGIPRDGYSSIGLFEDGLPVQHDPGLGFLNADQSFRFDETHLRVEAVRGGPSSIFASNAPGALVNFITRRGGDRPELIARAEGGDWGSYRGDLWFGAPIAEEVSFSIGGFYREDEGLRDTQFTANRGGQVRANLSGSVGPGSFFFDVKHINDRVAFFLPVPLTFDRNGDTAGVPGFDPLRGTFPGRATQNLLFRNVGGDFPLDLSDGTHIRLTQATAKLDLELGGGFKLANAFRVRVSDTTRNGLFPATVGRATDRLSALRRQFVGATPGVTDVVLRYADTGAAFDPQSANGNGLIVDATISGVEIGLDEVINDLRLTAQVDAAGRHDAAVGFYYAGFDVSFDRFGSTALLEANENARLLDIVAVDAAGRTVVRGTDRGFTRYGNQFNNASNTSDVVALYASDEWSLSDRLRIDLGARWERLSFNGRVENTRVADLGDPATLADNQVITGAGTFGSFDRAFDDFGYTAGVNFQPQANFGLFARYTSTYRLPNATDFLGTAVRTDLVKEDITLAEAGVKYSSRLLDLFVTGFLTYFEGVRFTSNEFNPATGGFVERVEFADARTLGVEAEGTFRPTPAFDLQFVVTYQEPEFRNFRFNERVGTELVQRDFSGNQLLRVPQLALRFVPGLNLLGDRLRVQAEVEHFSRRFADAANTVPLPAYWLVGGSARLRLTDQLSLFVIGDNLTNEIGLTEGNPRAGQFVGGDAGAQFYLARPVFGRNFRASVLFQF
jgi:outer membrane receptor protein involved in Fe transport